MVIIGAAAAARLDTTAGRRRPPLRLLGFSAALCTLALAGAWSWLGLQRISRWQAALADSARLLHPLAEIRARLDALDQDSTESPADIAADAAALSGLPPPSSPREFDIALQQMVVQRGTPAAGILEHAARVAPTHIPTVEAWARLHMAIAASAAALGRLPDATDSVVKAEEIARELVARAPRAQSYSILANILTARYQLDVNPVHLTGVIQALERADRLDPYGLTIPVRLMRACTTLGRTAEAGQWAQTALERDELQRLDPLRRLSDRERDEVLRAIAAAKPGS
jgi:tetratricopeptide (TPR) repeat protein